MKTVLKTSPRNNMEKEITQKNDEPRYVVQNETVTKRQKQYWKKNVLIN